MKHKLNYPALALIELNSIAGGILVCDALLKKASVEILIARIICPGKYIVVFHGEVANVEESLQAGLQAGKKNIIDHLFLPQLHQAVISALKPEKPSINVQALAVIETFTVASAIIGADAACKAAEVELLELRIWGDMGGKACFILNGVLHDVEAAVEAAHKLIMPQGLLLRTEIIARPHQHIAELFHLI